MKAFIVQPPYSRDYAKSDEFFKWEMDMLDECDESMDIIVFPESCDVPAYAPDEAHNLKSIEKYQAEIMQKASETAKRCNAIVVINAHVKEATGHRNSAGAGPTISSAGHGITNSGMNPGNLFPPNASARAI